MTNPITQVCTQEQIQASIRKYEDTGIIDECFPGRYQEIEYPDNPYPPITLPDGTYLSSEEVRRLYEAGINVLSPEYMAAHQPVNTIGVNPDPLAQTKRDYPEYYDNSGNLIITPEMISGGVTVPVSTVNGATTTPLVATQTGGILDSIGNIFSGASGAISTGFDIASLMPIMLISNMMGNRNNSIWNTLLMLMMLGTGGSANFTSTQMIKPFSTDIDLTRAMMYGMFMPTMGMFPAFAIGGLSAIIGAGMFGRKKRRSRRRYSYRRRPVVINRYYGRRRY